MKLTKDEEDFLQSCLSGYRLLLEQENQSATFKEGIIVRANGDSIYLGMAITTSPLVGKEIEESINSNEDAGPKIRINNDDGTPLSDN